ncbi:MAG: Wzz/FepE/Etk N-terminal domain-containing protein [Proteobacteria bacterium]|nr:Wzz/FepE/Etk N-terminal domain-containing protein [Pseudomonadota bacterium]
MEENPNKTEYVDDDEINLLDYLIVLVKRKRLIAYVTLGAMLITAIYSLILPSVYKAETRILPPQQSGQGSAAQLLGQLGGAAGLIGLPSGGLKTSSGLYIAMLKTNNILDRMIDRFDLMKLYKAKSRVGPRRALSGAVDAIDDKKSGIITISVADKDPKRAAQFANAFVEELKTLNKGLAVTEASQRRLFFEEQLEDVKKALVAAEEDIKGFQEKTGVMSMEPQVQAVILAIANLKAGIAAKEVELRVLKTYSTASNPDVKKAEEGLKGLKAELNNLQVKNKIEHEPLMPTGEAPGVGLEYARKLRNFKFYETLYELLIKQHEAAKLDEAKDATIIQVVDKAEPPEQRFKPKRRQMVMIAGVVGLFLSIFAAFIMEYTEKSSSNPENRERMNTLKTYFGISSVNIERIRRFKNRFIKRDKSK